ncbi:helix-turn-helix domain-containing protein [uncultured Kordia sp.]|uniref:helix-turn-helix domain-containing protein n=1 Tax=uncultured Kordia sp. TaxID=507699 RepID=UPI002627E02A|nr:helix-turn-helix domain-containing protein [uncultured Kordia sp.]
MFSYRYFLIILCFSCTLYGQQATDSLTRASFKELETQIAANTKNPEIYQTYTNAFFNRAKAKNDSLRIGKGFYFLRKTTSDFTKKIQYLDSAILYTKNLKHEEFPAHFYLAKGTLFYYENDYAKALDNYLLAEKTLKNRHNVFYYDAKYNIGFMQRTIGDYESAEQTFLDCLEFESTKNVRHDILFQLSSIYYESGQHAKATAMNTEGIALTLKNEQLPLYYHFVVNEGINLSISGNHLAAIDSIEKALPNLHKLDQLIGEFYVGKSYDAIGKSEKALYYFRKIDTAFSNESDILLPLRESYEFLIKNAKQKDDKTLQLYYTNRLLKLDSIHHLQYKELSQTIVKEYDIPRLLDEKETLIVNLTEDSKQTNQKLRWSIGIGAFISILGLLILFYYYRLRIQYQKRFDAIISQQERYKIEQKENIPDTKDTLENSVELDASTTETILERLRMFEVKKLYLTNQISLHEVAKIAQTNSKYLSKIINSHKNKTFTNYINDLRVDYTIDRIQNDEMYKKYTIKAIAQEAGFTNSGAFLRAFQKKTGLKPSYFIKKVRATEEK